MRAHRNSNNDVRMSLKRLHYLAALKIPEVHLVVFATGDDPFAASDAEARCDTKLLIRMSDVCLETAGSLIVP